MGDAIRSLHLIEDMDLKHGGVTRAVLDLTCSLRSLGFGATLATPMELPSPGLFPNEMEMPELVRLGEGREFRAQLCDLIEQCDVVHIHAPWWLKNPWIVSAATRLKRPVILSAHGMLNDWSLRQKQWKKWIYRFLVADKMFRKCVVHCTAEEERRQVEKRITPIATEVIPLVIDRCYFSGSVAPAAAVAQWPFLADEGVTKLLFLGRLHPVKSPEIAISILGRLPNSTLAIAGTGDPIYVDSLKSLAENLGVSNRIHWLGMVGGDMKHSLMAGCDLMVLPTQQENFGLAQVEALGCGLRLVTTKGTNNWRELQQCGAIIADRTVNGFVEAIENSKLTEVGRKERLESQRAKLSEWISPNRIATQYVEMYRRYATKTATAPSSPELRANV